MDRLPHFVLSSSDRPKDSNRFLRLRSHVGLSARRLKLKSQISRNIDPLSAALAPPENESFTQRQKRRLKEIEARRVSDAIDEDLERERARMADTERKARARRDSLVSAQMTFSGPEEEAEGTLTDEERYGATDVDRWVETQMLDPAVVLRAQLQLFTRFLGFDLEEGTILCSEIDLRNYLTDTSDTEPDEHRASARRMLTTLINAKFEELCADIAEEIVQRKATTSFRTHSADPGEP